MIGAIIGLILSLAWIYLLFRIGQKKDNAFIFYMLLYAPVLISLLLIGVISFTASLEIFNTLSAWTLIILLVVILERLAWGITLNEISGEDRLVWFYIAYLVPFFGWFLYRLTNIR